MRKNLTNVMLALLAAAMLTNCAEPVEDIDRTQPNLYSKSLFQGEWYFARTVVDAPFETGATFTGDRQEYLIGAEDFPAYKIRWRIEENYLYACRADEPTIGVNSEGRGFDPADPSTRDEIDLSNAEARARNDLDPSNPQYVKFPCTYPVAAFPIYHVDVTRQYNAATGEQSNTIIENMFDRQWHERDYVRINWSNQFVTDIDYSLMAQARLGWASVSTVAFVQEEEGDCRVKSFDGSIDYSQCNEGELPPMIEDSDNDGQTDSIMVTNRITIAPDGPSYNGFLGCWQNSFYNPGLSCTNSTVAMRLSFMRVPQRTAETAYEELYYPDAKFERFGMWRVTKNQFTEGRGTTDFRHMLATRFHIWEKTNTCDADGNCTPIPLAERTLKPIKYYLNREYPRDLVPAAFQVAKQWNDAMNGIRPGIDITETCQVVCGDGKSQSECTAEDRNWRMEGTCAFTLDENNGSQFLGDLRYNYIAFIEDPGSSTPCGVGGPANDGETGELINGVAYVYGKSCFDYVETRVMDMVDLLCAQEQGDGQEKPAFCTNAIEENQYIRGQLVNDIMQAQGYVWPAPIPIRGMAETTARARDDERVIADLEGMRADMEDARMNRGMINAKRARVREAGLGRMMVTSELARAVSNGRTSSGHDLTEQELELVDPLNENNITKRTERLHNHMAAKAADPAEYFFNDRGLWALVSRHRDMSREALSQMVREEFFKAVTLHELGHNMGLRHNFEASFDRTNYFPEYWDLRDAAAARFEELYNRAAPADFSPSQDSDETAEQFAARYETWNADRELYRDIEHDLGIREVKYTSIMDYHGATFGDWLGLGDYDKAAMRFLYAGLVDRVNCATLDDCLQKDADTGIRALHDRTHVTWYMGGELCETDSDCPYSEIGQNCQFNRDQGRNYCSNWDADEKQSGRLNVRQMFCSDDRVPDQPFCNRFDEGESSEEIVRTAIQEYERGFVRNNFRHFRRNFAIWSYYGRIKSRYFDVIGNQMQSLLYKYFFEPGFRSNDQPGGFEDMFRATVIGFDFLGNILAQPEAGSYEWDEDKQVYTFLDMALHDPNIVNEDLINLPLGQGKTLFSSYEEGYFGEIERLNYIGVFYDKIAALEAITQRTWGADAGQNDERFLLSFYDFFPVAFTKIIGAFMSGDEAQIGLLYDPATNVMQKRTFWDGSFLSDEVDFDAATLEPAGRKIEPGASSVLRIYSLIYGYLNTPIWYDNSFNQKARVFEVGGETGFSVTHLAEDAYIECVSPLSGRRFVATIYDGDLDSIGAKVLRRCSELSARYTFLNDAMNAFLDDPTVGLPDDMSEGEADRELRTVKNELSTQENSINNMIHMIDIIGIGAL